MCTATEAKTLQQVHGGYNSFFRKVIPVKRVQKPIRRYTRLTVYGNPGRVVNGYARGFLPYFAGRRGTACGAMLVLVPTGNPPSLRFGHPDVTTDDTAPPHARARLERGVAIPAGSDIRVPSRVLSAAKQGESGAPERVGSPAGAKEGYSVPTPYLQERRKGIAYPPPTCRNEDEYRFPCGAKLRATFPCGSQ